MIPIVEALKTSYLSTLDFLEAGFPALVERSAHTQAEGDFWDMAVSISWVLPFVS